MADLSQINIDGTIYSIKDVVARQSGGGGLSQLVIVTAEDFAEETITLTNADDGTTLTKTADSNGVAKFNVSSAGTWTATADDDGTTVTLGSVTLNVSEINYSSEGVKFAVHYSENDNNPDSVDYPVGYDNSNWSTAPAHMDFANNRFDYGAWDPNGANASKLKWLFPKSCMLAYDGTVSYYLNENDESKKLDGTASDIGNTSFAGNAMMEWGQNGKKIWWKFVPDADGKGVTFCVADHQVDAGYECWNHHDKNGVVKNHFYTPKYVGYFDGTRQRSLSGQTPTNMDAAATIISRCRANNPDSDIHWDTELYVDYLLVTWLTVLITKSLNSQSKIGKGISNTSSDNLITGNLITRGMFWGSSSTSETRVTTKIWGMEAPWGSTMRFISGLIRSNGKFYVKLTYGTEDGSTTTDYNTTGSGYIQAGNCVAAAMGNGYISHMDYNGKYVLPATHSGSTSTYYCDTAGYDTSAEASSTTSCAWYGGYYIEWAGAFHIVYGYSTATYIKTYGRQGQVAPCISYR